MAEFTGAPLLTVVSADARRLEAVVDAAGVDVVAVGIPVVKTDSGLRVAAGVPEVITAAGWDLDTSLPEGLPARRGFGGAAGETLLVAAPGRPAVVHVGCGDETRLSVDVLRRAAASLVRVAGRSGAAVFVLPDGLVASLPAEEPGVVRSAPAPRRAAQALAEGAVLSGYRFTAHKTDDPPGRIATFLVAGSGLEPEVVAEGVRRGILVAGATCFARDLVNEPPSSMSPVLLAEAVGARLQGQAGLRLDVWDEHRIADERLGGLLGVSRGSAEPPRLLWVTYEPPDPVEVDGKVPHVVLVGKGITFDSGGLSLKTADGMVTMKTDMSGAAIVMAALSACPELGVRVRVTAIAPVTENMPGGRATKPGDVLTARNGRTIEVLNTDAEGRLVLADGLSLAAELEPDAIIDLATLTGACVVALGRSVAGLFGNDDRLIDRVSAASERAGEPTWPLPIPDQYRSDIDSDIADMKNMGKAGQAGAIAAAMLLERFVAGVPWAHLDIAGPARADEDDGILVKGGTGFGVRTLLELVEQWAAG